MALLVGEDRRDHVVRDRVGAVGLLDDPVVVLDRTQLGLDDALDDVDDVGLVLGRLEVGLLGGELHRTGDHPVERLDVRRELLRMQDLVLDVGLQCLHDLLGAHAFGVRRARDVVHHRLDLHPVRLRQQLDDG